MSCERQLFQCTVLLSQLCCGENSIDLKLRIYFRFANNSTAIELHHLLSTIAFTNRLAHVKESQNCMWCIFIFDDFLGTDSVFTTIGFDNLQRVKRVSKQIVFSWFRFYSYASIPVQYETHCKRQEFYISQNIKNTNNPQISLPLKKGYLGSDLWLVLRMDRKQKEIESYFIYIFNSVRKTFITCLYI